MKIPETTLRLMQDAIVPLDTIARRERYLAGDFPRSEAVNDLSKRYRWDLFYDAAAATHELWDIVTGYNDQHIDTALRRLVKPLGRETIVSNAFVGMEHDPGTAEALANHLRRS